MGQNEREILPLPPPVHGGVEGHQRKSPHGIHVLCGKPFLCGHGPQTQWAKGLHWMDQTEQLLSWIGG